MKPFLWAFALAVSSFRTLAVSETTRVFVVLEREPLAALQEPGRRAAAAAVSDRRAQLAGEQGSLAAEVERRAGRVLEHYTVLNNALFIEVPTAEIPALRALPGVKAIQPERHFERCTSTSAPFVGAARTWSLPGGGFTGRGRKIAIIDSGIDYTHADFGGVGTVAAYQKNNAKIIEAGSFPTAKVVGGTDFVGDNYDSGGVTGSATPVPDPDPLDPSANGHGTHVAGIAAGQGVTKLGKTFNGPYTSTLAPADFDIGPGVAPEASLYALKIFGSGGSSSSSIILKALNWAADPNDDGDTSDHLDVVNLSLGSPFGDDVFSDVESGAVDRLSRLGVVVAIAAGNSGNTAYITSSPGTAARGITVANSYDDGFELTAIQVNAPAAVAGELGMVEGSFTPSLASHAAVTAQVVACNPIDACDTIRNTAQLNGKIVLIDRGTCFFADKIRAVQNAGAIGVIMVNNVEGPPIVMGGSGDTSDITIPGVMITRADGLRLRAQVGQGLSVTLKNGVRLRQPEVANTLNEGSSRGPSLGSGSLKPDIAAPGSSIQSAEAGNGFTGIELSGTSMAAPHVTGAAALVRQAHPTWSAEDLKASLMNTATGPMRDTSGAAYPESRVGAGALNVFGAVQTSVIAKVADDSGRVSLSFPFQVISAPVSLPAKVRIVNHGTVAASYRLSSSNTLDQPGARLEPAVEQVTIPAGGSVLVNVSLELDPTRLVADADRSSPATVRGGSPRYGIPEASGQLWLREGPAGSENLHLPWHVVVRAASKLALSAVTAGLPEGPTPVVTVPVRGDRVVPQPLLGLFQFGSQTNGAAGSFLAVGAASDAAVTDANTSPRVFFALATTPGWITPQRYTQNLDIELDIDDDGIADLTLSNGNVGSLGGGGIEDYDSANDGLVTGVQYSDGSEPEIGEVWNALPPDFRDTASQPAGRVVLAAKVDLLGLPEGQTSFRYRGVVDGSATGGSLTTAWHVFDYAQPFVDATPFGLRSTPWCDATNARVQVNRSAAAGRTIAEVMVIPQHNAAAGYQRLRLNLTTEDVNGNGLPDAWELLNLGDLDSTGLATADRDGDGFPDAAEFLAGTDPRDPQSRLVLLPPAIGDTTVRWQSVAGHSYSLWRADTLNTPFRPVARNVVATPPANALTDPEPISGSAVFYRVQLE